MVAERILEGHSQSRDIAPGVAVLSVEEPLYNVTKTIAGIAPSILPTSTLKIDHAKVRR